MKRPYPPSVYDPDSVLLHADSCVPLVREDHHNDSAITMEDSLVVITQGTNEKMSDFFPQKSVSKTFQEQQLDVAKDILAHLDEEQKAFSAGLLKALNKMCSSYFLHGKLSSMLTFVSNILY